AGVRVEAIRTGLAGHLYLTPLVYVDALVRGRAEGRAPGHRGRLTRRQREELQLVAEGRTVKEIAAALTVSAKTVEYHKAPPMDRLNPRTTDDQHRFPPS